MKKTDSGTRTANLFALNGGQFHGVFGSVTGGFTGDYSHEAGSPAYVAAVFGTSSGHGAQPAARVVSISGGHAVKVTLTCPATSGSCLPVTIIASLSIPSPRPPVGGMP